MRVESVVSYFDTLVLFATADTFKTSSAYDQVPGVSIYCREREDTCLLTSERYLCRFFIASKRVCRDTV